MYIQKIRSRFGSSHFSIQSVLFTALELFIIIAAVTLLFVGYVAQQTFASSANQHVLMGRRYN